MVQEQCTGKPVALFYSPELSGEAGEGCVPMPCMAIVVPP